MVTDKIVGAAGNIGAALTGVNQKDLQANGLQTPFASVVQSIIGQSQDLGKQAQTAITGLLSGQGVEVHDVVIASQKASAAFELALQVRNKAVSAYQQMMAMQF